MIWYAPALRFDGEAVAGCARIVEQILPEFGFEPIVSFQGISPRCVYAVISIIYDRDRAGDDDRAERCYKTLIQKMNRNGFYPYRLGISSMDFLDPPDDDSAQLFRLLKRGLDPNDILAPGRYDFRCDWDEEAPPGRPCPTRRGC